MRLELLALFAAGSTALAAPVLEARQNDPDYGNTWNDPVIEKPRNFVARRAGGACEFQLVYEKEVSDNRYDLSYVAEYADGTYTGKPYLTGTLAADNVWWTNTLTPFRMGIKTVFFPDACTNGKIPVSFRARFALRSGYTYQNRYTTPSVRVVGGDLPPAPQNVVLRNNVRPSTVSWSPVAGAQSYIVQYVVTTDSEVGPTQISVTAEVTGGATSFSSKTRIDLAAVIALYDGTVASGAKRFSSIKEIRP